MAEAAYRVISQSDGYYRVEFVEAGIVPRVTTGFKTESEALTWIEQDKRMTAAAERWGRGGPPSGREG